ncbi:MAG: sulfurtransferase [Synergistaceae bacterium]|jgi:3-mercaptopyruvate sulfurtransferase SseA|nr:sulfurtransferase [Synergistaceae bacterium]
MLSITIIAVALMAGVVLAADVPTDGTETYLSYVATTEWLKANLDKVVIIDARDPSLYKGQQGHLPGAVNAEWKYFANVSGSVGNPKWATVLEPEALAKKIGALGVDGKKPVIVYGDGGDWGNAGWVVWVLRLTGFKDARILDGGFTAWRASGGKTDSKTNTNKAVSYPNTKFNESYIVSTEWMKENVQDASIGIVDVRTQSEYTGESRFFGERRPGHIPGAINFPIDRVFTPDFKLLPEADLQSLLSESFPDKERTIILYDTSGVRSAFMTMAFRLAGYKNARNYDASYQVWCSDADTEIAQGPNPR